MLDLESYQEWARLRGHRPDTIRTRVQALHAADKFFDIDHATDVDVVDYLERFTQWTRHTYRNALASYYRFLDDTGRRPEPPRVPPAPKPEPRPRPVSDIELATLLVSASPRMRVWLMLAAYAGLRAGEIAATGRQHLDGNALELPYTKGGQPSRVQLPAWVADELRACSEWSVSARCLSTMASDYMTSVGVTPGIHRLRHWHATTMLRQTKNLRLVQRAMRHKSISSTVLYTLVDDDELSMARGALPRVA